MDQGAAKRKRLILRRWITSLAVVYLLICVLYYFYQHLMYFQPKELDVNHAYSFPFRARIGSTRIRFDSTAQIDVIRFQPDSGKAKGVVLFFHGNRFNVSHYASFAPYFTRLGWECWMPDYPGYGRSRGEIEQGMLYGLALQLYGLAERQYLPEQIVIYGKSIGTGLAAYLASQRPCRDLILETPYYSLSSLTQSFAWFLPVNWLLRFNLATGRYLHKIQAPVTVLHGSRDELIPLANAARLLGDMKPGDRFYVVRNGRHNNLPDFPLYHHVVDSVLMR